MRGSQPWALQVVPAVQGWTLSRDQPISIISIKAVLLTSTLSQALAHSQMGSPPTLIMPLCSSGEPQHSPGSKAQQTPAAWAVDIKCFIFNIKNQYF